MKSGYYVIIDVPESIYNPPKINNTLAYVSTGIVTKSEEGDVYEEYDVFRKVERELYK